MKKNRIQILCVLVALSVNVAIAQDSKFSTGTDPDLYKKIVGIQSPQHSTRPKLAAADIVKLAEKSAGQITMSNILGSSSATGFVVAKGIIATNHHVIADGVTKDAKIRIGSKENGLLYPLGRVIADDPDHDVALVEVHESTMFHTTTNPANIPPVILWSNSGDTKVGDRIYLYGNPQGLTKTFSDGIISAFRGKAKESLDSNTGELIQYTVPTSPGNSGSPVFNERGEVIAIHSQGFDRKDENGQRLKAENLNFAVPAAFIQALLNRIKQL